MLSQAKSRGRVIGQLRPSSSADAPLELTAQLARLRSALPRVVRRGASWIENPTCGAAITITGKVPGCLGMHALRVSTAAQSARRNFANGVLYLNLAESEQQSEREDSLAGRS